MGARVESNMLYCTWYTEISTKLMIRFQHRTLCRVRDTRNTQLHITYTCIRNTYLNICRTHVRNYRNTKYAQKSAQPTYTICMLCCAAWNYYKDVCIHTFCRMRCFKNSHYGMHEQEMLNCYSCIFVIPRRNPKRTGPIMSPRYRWASIRII